MLLVLVRAKVEADAALIDKLLSICGQRRKMLEVLLQFRLWHHHFVGLRLLIRRKLAEEGIEVDRTH